MLEILALDAALAEILSERGHILTLKKEEKRELKALSVDKMFPLSSLMAATGYLNSWGNDAWPMSPLAPDGGFVL